MRDYRSAALPDRRSLECEPERQICRSEETGVMLSVAENRVADGICRGLTEKEIADEGFRSPLTIHTQIKSIYRKVGVRKDTELLWWMICQRLGIIFDMAMIRHYGVRMIVKI